MASFRALPQWRANLSDSLVQRISAITSVHSIMLPGLKPYRYRKRDAAGPMAITVFIITTLGAIVAFLSVAA